MVGGRKVGEVYIWHLMYSRTLLYGLALYKDTSLLWTVFFLPSLYIFCKFNPLNTGVIVQFYPRFKVHFSLFLGMVIYDNELETKGNKIYTKNKSNWSSTGTAHWYVYPINMETFYFPLSVCINVRVCRAQNNFLDSGRTRWLTN